MILHGSFTFLSLPEKKKIALQNHIFMKLCERERFRLVTSGVGVTMEIVSLTNEKETIVVQSQVLPKYRQIIKLVIGIL